MPSSRGDGGKTNHDASAELDVVSVGRILPAVNEHIKLGLVGSQRHTGAQEADAGSFRVGHKRTCKKHLVSVSSERLQISKAFL